VVKHQTQRVAALASRTAFVTSVIDAWLSVGQRQKVEEMSNELRAMAQRTGSTQLEIMSAMNDCVLSFIDGRLEEAVSIDQDSRARAQEAGFKGLAGGVRLG